MTDLLHDLIFDYTLRTVALGSAVLGIVSGALGVFAVLRRQSLVGDAMSHAALPGIVLAFMLTGSKTPLVLLIGATIAGWLGALAVLSIVRASRLAYDTALAIVLSVFFGLGLVLLTVVQRQPDASQAGLDKFLFGQAATLVVKDVQTMSAVGIIAFLALMLIWKEIKLLSFDPDYARHYRFARARSRHRPDDAGRDRDRRRAADGGRGPDERNDCRPSRGGPAMDGSTRGDGCPQRRLRSAGGGGRDDFQRSDRAVADGSGDRCRDEPDRSDLDPVRAAAGVALASDRSSPPRAQVPRRSVVVGSGGAGGATPADGPRALAGRPAGNEPGRRRLAETLRQLADNQLVREVSPDTWALTDAGLRAVAVINPEAAE